MKPFHLCQCVCGLSSGHLAAAMELLTTCLYCTLNYLVYTGMHIDVHVICKTWSEYDPHQTTDYAVNPGLITSDYRVCDITEQQSQGKADFQDKMVIYNIYTQRHIF